MKGNLFRTKNIVLSSYHPYFQRKTSITIEDEPEIRIAQKKIFELWGSIKIYNISDYILIFLSVIRFDLFPEYDTRLSDTNFHLFERINGKQFVMGIANESAVKFAKRARGKNTTLICVTRRMIRVYLNFKQHFDKLSNRLCL